MYSTVAFALFVGVASAAGATGQPPVAEKSTGEVQAPDSQAQPQKPKKICRREILSGSNMTKKVCLTAEQWKQLQDD